MAASAKSTRRTASREQRRRQLIEATMKCIARRGLSGTTLADVARTAGLSQGIVNLHFKSKDNLLTDTLRYLADEYRAQFNRTLDDSGPTAADRLLALMQLDLSPALLDRRRIAVWFAFWGEVQSRPTYRKICDERDRYYDEVVEGLCEEIIADGGNGNVSAAAATVALTSMSNGLWLSYLLGPKTFDRQQALDAISAVLQSFFPKHFSG